jgi:hypothetical protein
MAGGGSGIAAGGVWPSASAISPTAQYSVKAARSVAPLSASRVRRSAWRRDSSILSPRSSRVVLAAWAMHFR